MKKKTKIILFVILGITGLLVAGFTFMVIKSNADMNKLDDLNRKMERQIEELKQRKAAQP